MKDFYNSIDCLVMPSKEETFGLTAIEAMSYKVPVIASDVSGICDIIKHGENSFIFYIKKKPVINLYRAMYDILNCKNLEQIKEDARNTAQQNSIEQHNKKLNKILDSLIQKRENNEKVSL